MGSTARALSRNRVGRWLVALGCICALHSARADSGRTAAIPWAYSAYFGTGVYRVEDGEKAYIFRVDPGWTWREPSLDENGRRTVGWRFKFPAALGVHDLDAHAIGGTLSLDNVGTVTVVPGVEVEIPIGPRWSLRPFAAVGWGTETGSNSSSAWVYWTGLKSRVAFPADGFEWAIVNALTYSGYTDSAHQSTRVLPLLTAFEFDRPTNKKMGGDPVHLYWHAAYTDYLNSEPLLLGSSVGSIDVKDEWELGMAFGKAAGPLRLWRFHWDRVGLAYRFSSDREFKGITVFFSSMFDR